MNNLNIKIDSLKYLGKVIIIDSNKNKYVYKNKNNYLTYEYLLGRDFNNIPKYFNNKDSNYDLIEYIEDLNIPKEQRLKDLINVISLLHKKTIYSKEIELDELKKIYEDIINNVDSLMAYYSDLNNYIDSIVFMSPLEYLLVSNIDLFYYLLNFTKDKILIWYNSIKDNKVLRYSLNHNNIDINHLIENDNLYLISWNKSKIDLLTNDLVQLYKKYYYDIDLNELINEYQKNNKLTSDEYLFLLIILAIPERIELSSNTYLDTNKLSNYIEYLKKIVIVTQKYDRMMHKS